MRRSLLLTLTLFAAFTIHAQQFGGFPPSTRWKQLNTDTARVIYPPRAGAQAQSVANRIHAMAATVHPLGGAIKKINVVLHNRTTLANGYVGLGPYRSEYYLIPGGNIFEFGNLPWQEQLAIHEYRHVQQYNNFNRGGSRLLGVLLGEEGRAVANALAVPDWFFEGDAVYAETALTTAGRGRMPFFLNGYRSLWKEGRSYNWMKLRNGSLKDFVPNHYPLGYLLVNYGYGKYGPDFWRKVTADASAFKGLFYPFGKAIERHAGVTFRSFRTEALLSYSHEVSRRRDQLKTRETVTNYYFPQEIGKDSILYLKDSYKMRPRFNVRVKGEEQAVAFRSITSEDWFSYRSGTIAYTAFSTHPRWSLVNSSDIRLLDIATGKEIKITRSGKYFSPDLSPDGTRLIAVSLTDSVTSALHLLDRKGTVLKTLPAPPSALFFQPRFVDSVSIVVGVRAANATVSMERIDLRSGFSEVLLSPSNATFGLPFVSDGVVYYTSSATGEDNLYSVRLSDKKVQQLPVGGTGQYFPSLYADTLRWSSFTSNGYKMQSSAIAAIAAAGTPPKEPRGLPSPFPVALAGDSGNTLTLPVRTFPSTPYSKAHGLLNFHSRRPAYDPPEYSFALYSQNILNTLLTEVFYRYNENEHSHATGLSASYGALFPVLTAGLDYTFGRHLRTPRRTYTLNTSEARVGYSIPLNFTSGRSFKYLTVGSNFVYSVIMPTGMSKDSLQRDKVTYAHHFLNWLQSVPKARKEIFPKWGYALSTAYRHRADGRGYQSLLGGQFYIPGLSQTHSFVASASFQQTDTSNVVFSNRFSSARGYNDRYFSRMWRAGGNYHFPLLYPDRGVANIVYLLRVRANVFYDHMRVYSRNKTAYNDLRSTGTELFFDTRWWNQLPVSFGIRYSRLLDAQKAGIRNGNVFEVILPVNLVPN